MIAINPNILQTPMADGSILLLQPKLGLYFELSDVSSYIFNALSEGESRQDIINSIVENYQINKSQVELDFDDLFQQLLKNDIILNA